MRPIVVLVVLMLLVQESAAWAQTAAPESAAEQVTYGAGSVLGTVLYTPLKAGLCALGGAASAFLFFSLYWVLSGRKWFKGPKVMGTPEELRAIERELDELEHGRIHLEDIVPTDLK